MVPNLAFDVGMNNGDDTAHYLQCGYRVVAIEANAVSCETAAARFQQQLSDGTLTILNVGISSSSGVFPFWVNLTASEHSSFDRAMASRFSNNVVQRDIQGVPFADILSQHGVPEYLKIDIEGADHLCLSALSKDDLPRFISVEAHSLVPLFQMQQLGYDNFKLVNQMFHNAPHRSVSTMSPARSAVAEWASSSRYAKALGKRFRKIRRRLAPGSTTATYEKSMAKFPAGEFPFGSSGPCGEKSFGPWRTFEEVAYDWLHLQMGFPGRATVKRPGWFDFHARKQTADVR